MPKPFPLFDSIVCPECGSEYEPDEALRQTIRINLNAIKGIIGGLDRPWKDHYAISRTTAASTLKAVAEELDLALRGESRPF